MMRNSAECIERTGKVLPLTPRVEHYFVEALRAIKLDDVQSPSVLRADYACLGGLVAIELKTLAEDGSERIDNVTEELSKRDDWPLFYGAAPMDAVIANLPDEEKVREKLFDRLGRAIVRHLHKANNQLGAHAKNFPRKNLVRVMYLINEDHEIYDPDAVAYVLHKAMRRMEGGQPLYSNIDAVIYKTERHAARHGDLIAYPVLNVEGHGVETAPWKAAVIDRLLQGWADWNGNSMHWENARERRFSVIDHIPQTQSRQKWWELEYRRNPYMRAYSKEQLRNAFDEAMAISTLGGVKDAPAKPPKETGMMAMKYFSHIMLEMNSRGIPITDFDYVPARFAAAAERLKLPPAVVDWFASDLGRSNAGTTSSNVSKKSSS